MRTPKLQCIHTTISNYLKFNTHPIIICIGSDRVIGDCLGPIVGQLLTTKYNIDSCVYGTLSKPITALNLISTLKTIKQEHIYNKIIAIDSCIGKINDVGTIKVLPHGVYPGSASGKLLPLVGDISITANVTHNEKLLSSLNLGFIYSLAESIAQELFIAFNDTSNLYNNYTSSK